jgi:transposase
VDIFSAQNARREFTMRPQKHDTYSREFREEAIRQARGTERPLTHVARELGVKYATLRKWVQDQERAVQARPGTNLAAENRRLRAENHQLRLEREILKKATAFFAKHSR